MCVLCFCVFCFPTRVLGVYTLCDDMENDLYTSTCILDHAQAYGRIWICFVYTNILQAFLS